MSDNELIEAMRDAYNATYLMSAVLAVVREHDSAALTAERERADRAERDCNGLSLDVQALTAERDALRERVARLVGALQDIARSEVWYASELREMARTALGDK